MTGGKCKQPELSQLPYAHSTLSVLRFAMLPMLLLLLLPLQGWQLACCGRQTVRCLPSLL